MAIKNHLNIRIKEKAVRKFINKLKCKTHYPRESSRMYLSLDLYIKKLYKIYCEPPSKDKEVNASTSNISDTIELQEHQHADDNGNVVVSDLLEIDKETSQQSKAPPFPCDLADWPQNISSKFQEYFLKNRPEQNIDKISGCLKQLDGKKSRCLQSSTFYKFKENGEKALREWLVYSPKSGCVYCYVCKLFSKKDLKLTADGYTDLKKHERSSEHITSISKMINRSRIEGRIDAEIEKSYLQEQNYWKNVLARWNFLVSFTRFWPEYGNIGSGHINFFSSTICNEFIHLLANEVKNNIITELQVAKYFSIIVDSTTDISHIDQLTVIIRYVLPNGHPVERFLGFVEIISHTAESLSNVLQTKLSDLNININYCRGQSYDNASNMSGKYNGLQAKIKEKTNNAHFVPCSSHSLNLVGNSAAESCLQASGYFENKICDTRWSARADAIKSIALGFSEIKDALVELNEDTNQKNSTRTEAGDLLNKMNTFEFALMTSIWKKILDRINSTSKSLQNNQANLTATCTLYSGLIEFVESFREQFDEIEEESKKIQPNNNACKDEISRVCKRNKFFDEGPAQDITLSGAENFKINSFFPICDKLIFELKMRIQAYDCVNEIFGVFFVEPSNERFNVNLVDEIIQFKALCKSNDISSKDPQEMLKFLIDNNILSTFSNVEVLFRIYLTIPISNASGERSFSTLKRVKTYLRNSLNEKNVSSLAILNVESDILEKLEINGIIDKFSEMKIHADISTVDSGIKRTANTTLYVPHKIKANERDSVWFYFLTEKDISTIHYSGQTAKCRRCQAILKTKRGSTKGLITHLKVHKIDLLDKRLNESPDGQSAGTSKMIEVVGLVRLKNSLTATAILEYLQKRLLAFQLNLSKDIVAVTTDGASTMVKVGKLITLMQQLCFAHGIQLAVIDVLYKKDGPVPPPTSTTYFKEDPNFSDSGAEIEYEDCEETGNMDMNYRIEVSENNDFLEMSNDHDLYILISRVSKTIRMFRKSPTKNYLLQKQIRNDHGKELKLIIDCKTRWSSMLDMLDRFNFLKNSIKKTLIDLNMLPILEWQTIKSVVKVLQPIKLIVEALCRCDIDLYKADVALKFMLKELSKIKIPLSTDLQDSLRKRIKQRRTIYSDIVSFLTNTDSLNSEPDCFKTSNISLIKSELEKLLIRLDNKDASERETSNDSDEDQISIAEILRRAENEPLKVKLQKALQQCSEPMQKETKNSNKPLPDIVTKEINLFANGGTQSSKGL
ncbi:unnamed protein product [Brassicogethes aeneus]|uniref:BED-type domain-containing protein n=1 Tax=Brassicogethes aeneus TaxID=1431903 RepID=A0A9P0B9I2_BRAAE|nr:unnamed protein product [Brassicogethes aeneus]